MRSGCKLQGRQVAIAHISWLAVVSNTNLIQRTGKYRFSLVYKKPPGAFG